MRLVSLVLLGASCSVFTNLEGLGRDGGIGSDASASDGSADAPAMVHVGTFSIDSLEVTQHDYSAFVAAKIGDPSGQPPECAWNVTYAPGCAIDSTSNLPAHCVNWCDAYAYCAWAGKRLCGAIDGGATPFNAYGSSAVDQWSLACTGGLGQTFSYGSTVDLTACNGLELDAGTIVPTGSLPKCQGGVPGLFDMSGNVGEWEDSCTPGDAGPDQDKCHIRGGYYKYNAVDLTCGQLDAYTRNNKSAAFGFRCCL